MALLLAPCAFVSQTMYREALSDPVFAFREGTTTLVAGDSHLEAALNPSYFPGSVNCSLSGESYFFTYYKVKHLLGRNPGIRRVVIGCAPHNFARDYQESFLFGAKLRFMEGYYFLMDEPGKRLIRSWKSSYIQPFLIYDLGIPLHLYRNRLLLKRCTGTRLLTRDVPFFGGFKDIAPIRCNAASVKEKIKLYFGRGENSKDGVYGSSYMAEYLAKIAELCQSRSVDLVLISTPVYGGYQRYIPSSARSGFEKIITGLQVSHPSVRFIDASDVIVQDNYFFDADHLNRDGARQFSTYCASILSEKSYCR